MRFNSSLGDCSGQVWITIQSELIFWLQPSSVTIFSFFLSFSFFFWTYLKLIMSVLQNFPINVITITSFDVLIVDKKFVGVRFEPLTLWLSDLSINGVWSHLHTPMHSSICLGMLVSHMQNFIWQVNFTPTLRKVCSVMLLPIIHLQLPEWKWALQFFCRHWL